MKGKAVFVIVMLVLGSVGVVAPDGKAPAAVAASNTVGSPKQVITEQANEPCFVHSEHMNLREDVQSWYSNLNKCGAQKLRQNLQCNADNAKKGCEDWCKDEGPCKESEGQYWKAKFKELCKKEEAQGQGCKPAGATAPVQDGSDGKQCKWKVGGGEVDTSSQCNDQTKKDCEKQCSSKEEEEEGSCKKRQSSKKTADGQQIDFPGYSEQKINKQTAPGQEPCGKQCDDKVKDTMKIPDGAQSWEAGQVLTQADFPDAECEDCFAQFGAGDTTQCGNYVQQCEKSLPKISSQLQNAAGCSDAAVKQIIQQKSDVWSTKLLAEDASQQRIREFWATTGAVEQQKLASGERIAAMQVNGQIEAASIGAGAQLGSAAIGAFAQLASTAMQGAQKGSEGGAQSQGGAPTPPPETPRLPTKTCVNSRGDTFTTTGDCPTPRQTPEGVVASGSTVVGVSDQIPIPDRQASPQAVANAPQLPDNAVQGRDNFNPDLQASPETTASVVGINSITGGAIANTGWVPSPAYPELDVHNQEKVLRQQFRQQGADLSVLRTMAGSPKTAVAFPEAPIIQERNTNSQQDLRNLYNLADEVKVTDRINIIQQGAKPNMYTLEGSANKGVVDEAGIIKLNAGGLTYMAIANPEGALVDDPEGNRVYLKAGTARYVGTGNPIQGWETSTAIMSGDADVMVLPLSDPVFLTLNKGVAPLAVNAVDLSSLPNDRVKVSTRGKEDLLLVGLNNIIPILNRDKLYGSSHIIYYKDAIPEHTYLLEDAQGYSYRFDYDSGLIARLRTGDNHEIFSTSNPPLFLTATETNLLYARPAERLPYVPV